MPQVEYSEEPGKMYYFRYPVAGGGPNDYLPVATTRPETILGDTAVAVNPEDERYKHLVGRQCVVPLSDRCGEHLEQLRYPDSGRLGAMYTGVLLLRMVGMMGVLKSRHDVSHGGQVLYEGGWQPGRGREGNAHMVGHTTVSIRTG